MSLIFIIIQWQNLKIRFCSIKEKTKGCVFFRDFIIDGLSVERNHVLVRISLVGGPLERILPPRTLEKVSGVRED